MSEVPEQFVLAVENMRKAQKAYFRTRERARLDYAKNTEHEVDRWLERLRPPKSETHAEDLPLFEDIELLKTYEGARKIVERMEAEDVLQGFWDHPAREIVRRAVGEWEDA